MKKNLFPTILISVLLALWGLVLFGYSPSQATVINKSSSSNSLMRGLVGWWTMDGRDTTSVTTSDRSSSGLHATRIGGVKTSVGKIGQAMFFDGTGDDDYLSYTTPTVNTTTISFWIKPNTLTLPNGHRMAISSGVDSTYISLSTSCGVGTCPFFSFNIGGIQRTVDSGTPVAIDKWAHLLITWDGAFMRVYVNGILRNTSVDYSGGELAGFTGGVKAIGKWSAANGYETSGSLDDIRFYNRALSPAEIVQLYTMGGDKINKTDLIRAQLRNGLVGHWTMDGADTTVTTSTDRSGRGNHGTRSTTSTFMTTGRIGQAAKFVSTNNNYIRIPANDALFSTGATGTFSFSFWIKSNSFSGTVFSKSHSCANEGHYKISASGLAIGLAFYSDLDTLGISYSSGDVLKTGVWNYVTITKQWGTANATKLYVNGVSKTFTPSGDDATRGTTYTDLLEYIGAQVDLSTCNGPNGPLAQIFNGSIDDMRVYNRILSQAEVTELYKMGGGVVNKTDTVKPTLKNSLLGHWTFDGADMTARTSTDRSGNGNDGYLLASLRPIPAMGKIGQGLKFDGSSRLVKIATSSSLGVLGNTGTISFWIKPGAVVAAAEDLISYGNGGQYSNGFFIYRSPTNQFNVYWKTGGPVISVANAFDLNKWQYFTVTNNNGDVVLYKNGVSIGTGTSGGTITNATFSYYIGGEDSAGWFTNSTMDDVRIYNRVISRAEIQQLYSMGK